MSVRAPLFPRKAFDHDFTKKIACKYLSTSSFNAELQNPAHFLDLLHWWTMDVKIELCFSNKNVSDNFTNEFLESWSVVPTSSHSMYTFARSPLKGHLLPPFLIPVYFKANFWDVYQQIKRPLVCVSALLAHSSCQNHAATFRFLCTWNVRGDQFTVPFAEKSWYSTPKLILMCK